MVLRDILFPVRLMFEGATGFRNWLFDVSLIKAKKVGAKVISIGNLTVGGTGKTPVTLHLLSELRRRGFSCGVVSRGYKRQRKGVLEVDATPGAALAFGDEPSLIKASFPDVPVVVGEKRVQAAEHMLRGGPLDFILCDDAFQHRKLHRDLNLLLLDATESVRNYRVMPVGRARERLVPALKRADFLVLTKTNLVDEEQLALTIGWLSTRVQKPILRADYQMRGLRSVRGELRQDLSDKVYLVSGVAKPDALEKTLGDRVQILKHRVFNDHHRYLDLEIEDILDEAARLGARWILTTAKDSMKLSAFPQLRERLWVVELGLELKGEVSAFYEAVDRLVRQDH